MNRIREIVELWAARQAHLADTGLTFDELERRAMSSDLTEDQRAKYESIKSIDLLLEGDEEDES